MGRGTRFRVDIAVSAVGQGLREAARYFGWTALCRVCLPLPPAGNRYHRYGSIIRSRTRGEASSSCSRISKLSLLAEYSEVVELGRRPRSTHRDQPEACVRSGWEGPYSAPDPVLPITARRRPVLVLAVAWIYAVGYA